MSDGLKAALAPPSAKIIPFSPRRIGAFVMEHRAIAAGLVCAAAVWGVSLSAGRPGELGPNSDGYILASSQLYRVLQETPSSVPVKLDGGAEVTPRLSFAAASGEFCRQYLLRSSAGGSEAIACREDDNNRWRVEVATYGPLPPSGDYVTAAGPASALDAFVDREIRGEPLDADGEAEAIREGWRNR
jgi:hypothetical protein